ncbi:MAG TPA: 30S ribosomal protein S20 [Candidatus Dormibacteraeota bacterium]
MAKRTASAKKQARASVRRTVRNRAVRSEVKTKIVKARRSLTGGPVAESDRYAIALEAIRALDRAASKGILHRNNAARRKARLARQLVKLGGASAAAAATAGGRSKKGAPPAKGAAAAAAKTKAPDKKAAGKKPGSK